MAKAVKTQEFRGQTNEDLAKNARIYTIMRERELGITPVDTEGAA